MPKGFKCTWSPTRNAMLLRRIESISMSSLRFAKKFFLPYRIKHFGAYIWKLSAES